MERRQVRDSTKCRRRDGHGQDESDCTQRRAKSGHSKIFLYRTRGLKESTSYREESYNSEPWFRLFNSYASTGTLCSRASYFANYAPKQ